MKILIAGDFVPTKSNIDKIENSRMEKYMDEELFNIWNMADVRIFNLEAPLVDKGTSLFKSGPNICAPKSSIAGILQLKPTVISLANNHIMDYGDMGLNSTITLLKKDNISYVGAGNNLSEAICPFIYEYKNMKIGIYSCAEHEFSIATDNESGANPFDPFTSFDHISELSEKCNKIIVLYHGGKEKYRYPLPYHQKVCRKLIENGANLVVCQHSHCIGCEEKYLNGTIVYGQGNFIFDQPNDNYTNTGLLIEMNFDKENEVGYIPFIKVGNMIRKANELESKRIMDGYFKRTDEIKNREFIKNKLEEYHIANSNRYLYEIAGISRILKVIDILFLHGLILKRKYKGRKIASLLNCFTCETHKEIIISYLKYIIKKDRL